MRAVLAMVLALAPADASEQRLRDTERRLADERAAAARLAEKEVGLLGQLAAFERLIDLEARSLKAAQARLKRGARKLEASEARAQAADGELARRTRALGPRLTARYRMGREGYLRFLLGARSIGDVLRRRRLLAALVTQDIEALADLRAAAGQARAARDELAKVRDELARSATAELDRRRHLQESVEQQRVLLASVQEERAAHQQAIRELEDAARALSQKLAEMGGASPAPAAPRQPLGPQVPFKKLRGKLLFPVEAGRVEVRFGRHRDPRFGNVTLQRGIDIRAPEGTEVHAIHQGRVVHAGWFKGYGNLVIVDHGEGFYSLMAHLGLLQHAVGDQILQGETVGTVGDTGSLKGPYLYFELRQGTKPLDPERWLLRKRKPASTVAKKPPG